jgi:sarcosine oxidase gamma subunit
MMTQKGAVLAALLFGAAVPLLAQQPTPQPTTTSIERGDRNTSIRASATGQQTQSGQAAGEVREPAEPRTPFTDNPAARSPQAQAQRHAPTMSPEDRAKFAANSDVYLEVPDLHVDQILLDVDNVRVHLALNAQVANLVSLKAGADATIGRVKLEIRGVQAEAYLVVRLDNVEKILDRTLTTIDKNPELLNRLIGTVNNAVGTVGNVANTALQPGGVVDRTVGTVGQTLNNVTAPGGLLSQTVNTVGQTVQRTLDTTGNIVERTLDTTGKVVNQQTVGRLLDLPVVSQTTNAAGQVVKQVRDTTGSVIEYTLDSAGKIVNSRVVSQATGQRR